MNNTDIKSLVDKLDSYFTYRYGPQVCTGLNIVQSVLNDPDLEWVYNEKNAIPAIMELVKNDRYVEYTEDQINKMTEDLTSVFKNHNK